MKQFTWGANTFKLSHSIEDSAQASIAVEWLMHKCFPLPSIFGKWSWDEALGWGVRLGLQIWMEPFYQKFLQETYKPFSPSAPALKWGVVNGCKTLFNEDSARLYLLSITRSASTGEKRHTSTAEGNPASHKGYKIIVFSLCLCVYTWPITLIPGTLKLQEVSPHTLHAPLNAGQWYSLPTLRGSALFLIRGVDITRMLCCFCGVFYHTCILLQGAHHTMVCYCGAVRHGLHAVSSVFSLIVELFMNTGFFTLIFHLCYVINASMVFFFKK